jgi:hypothetical protein
MVYASGLWVFLESSSPSFYWDSVRVGLVHQPATAAVEFGAHVSGVACARRRGYGNLLYNERIKGK